MRIRRDPPHMTVRYSQVTAALRAYSTGAAAGAARGVKAVGIVAVEVTSDRGAVGPQASTTGGVTVGPTALCVRR